MIKAYFVMRTDLNMPPAKLAVQVGHGVQRLMEKVDHYTLQDWKEFSDSRKIVVQCSSDEKLQNLLNVLKDEILTCEIWDSGYTVFNGRTRTGICFMYNDDDKNLFIEKKIKRLQLWKD